MPAFITRCNLLECLTPLHIGEGGMRLGMVDNALQRHPVTHEPYVPGTTMLGNYSQYVYRWARSHCPTLVDRQDGCLDYGTAKAPRQLTRYQFLFGRDPSQAEMTEEEIHEKVLRCSHARILWIPCMPLKGPRLVTTPERCQAVLGVKVPAFAEDELLTHPDNLLNDGQLLKQKADGPYWLNLKNLKITADPQKWPDDLSTRIQAHLPTPLQSRQIPKHLVFLAEDVFARVICKNIEIRTSVRIDRVSNAGKDGALFTYELLPRGTLLYFFISVSCLQAASYVPPPGGMLQAQGVDGVWEILAKAQAYFTYVGIGGMTSRGFGKCKIIACQQGV